MLADFLSAKRTVGIDIGTGTVKAVELQQTRTGVDVNKVAVKEIPFSESETPETRTATILQTVSSLLKENRISTKRLIFGLAGHQVFIRKLRLPAASEERLAKIITYEARQQIPFPLDRIQLDYQVTPIPDTTEVEVLLVGSKKDSISEYMNFLRKINLKPVYLDVTPVALYNFHKIVDPTPTEEAVALINLGASTTDISIVRGGMLSLTRTAPHGGNDITRGIAAALNISLAEAEAIKIKEGKVGFEFEELIEETGGLNEEQQREKNITAAISSALDKLVGEIRRTFDYYISQPDGIAVGKIILSGGTSKLLGIDRFMEMKLGTTVQLIQNYPTWQSFGELRNANVDQLPFLTTCIGLALRGTTNVLGTIKVDFLPAGLKSVREFSAKRIEVAIATAILAIIIFLGSRFGAAEIDLKQQAIDLLKTRALASRTGYEKYQKLNKTKEDLRKKYENLIVVLGARTYWLDISAKLSKMTPVDMWFTKVIGNSDYTMIIEGKSLTNTSVTVLAENFGRNPHYFKSATLEMMREVTDEKLGKPVTVFRFKLECNPPKLTI